MSAAWYLCSWVQTDRELFAAWQDGDKRRGSELVERHFASVFRFFRSKVGEDAEELTQKTFLGCVESRDRYDESRSFRAYLFGIARKQLLRHFEGRGRGFPADALSRMSIADLAPSPSRLAASRQEAQRLLDAMQHIPVDAQVALELVYWEGMPLADVAAALGVATGTIKSRLHRARAQLQKVLEDLGDTADGLEERAQKLKQAVDETGPRRD